MISLIHFIMMAKKSQIGLLVLNREKSRFFEYDPKRLNEIEDFCHKKLHLPDNRESFQGMSAGGHLLGFGKTKEKTRLKQHDFEVFARKMTKRLDQCLAERAIQRLLIIAPPEVKKTIHQHFQKQLTVPFDFPIEANLVSKKWQEILECVNKEVEV